VAKAEKRQGGHLAAARETIESVAIAIVLAFVLRAFVVEAFVIPTGSMAPRLMGQHWQFECQACGYHYAFGRHAPSRGEAGRGGAAGLATSSHPVCPNCHHEHRLGRGTTFSGDRVLVLKYLYRLRQPQPWDVVVFKNPQDNQQNYIKRLIGLPGQMIELVHGDVYFRQGKDLNDDGVIDKADFLQADKEGKWPWQILRKPHGTQKVMWQVVFDNDYQPDHAVYSDRGAADPWQSPWPQPAGTAWDLTGQGRRAFAFRGSASAARLSFQPPPEWECFCPNYAYNQRTGTARYDAGEEVIYDLKLSFQLVPEGEDTRVGLHLSSFQHHFRGWVGADGTCVLEHGPAGEASLKEIPRRALLGPLEPDRGHDIALTHVDQRATLWVNGECVLATTDQEYGDDKGQVLAALRTVRNSSPQQALPPPTVALWAVGGKAQLRHVRVMRDVYYTSPNAKLWEGGTETSLPGHGTTGNPITLRKFFAKPDLDEFYVLGDNSPASKDSRMWGKHATTLREDPDLGYEYRDGTVPRYSMIGKAFFVYWPGGFPVMSSARRRLPIVPNVGRMRLIR